MNVFCRSRIVLPLASLMTVFALAAHAQDTNNPTNTPASNPAANNPAQTTPPPAANPPAPAAKPAKPRAATGAPRVARTGAPPTRHFGGQPYRGRLAWEGGHWRHEMHNGRMGWWWDVGGVWYWYPERLEGPPAYISDDYADDVLYGPPVAAYAPTPGAYPPPPPPPPPPDPGASAVGGAIVGGLLGGLLTGRASGAAAGAIVGGATGAIAGATAASRPGYWMAEGSCYYRYPDGQYVLADPRWCY
jgi:hypothetical protein